MNLMSDRQAAEAVFRAALQAADPAVAVRRHIPRIRETYARGGFERLLAVGFGKAATVMAGALEDELGNMITAGLAITKYGHIPPGQALRRIGLCEAGHPVPDENGLRRTAELMALLRGADARTLVVCLVSGGGSALLVAPCEGVSLAEKQLATDLLLKSGADIVELNTVRKHLSRVKGGRLAELAHPATVISLIVSDVLGDPLDVIASGPTCPDPSSYCDALGVIEHRCLVDRMPSAVLDVLRRGAAGALAETPKPGTVAFERVEHVIVGSLAQAIAAASERAETLGFHTLVLSESLQGEARKAAGWLVQQVLNTRTFGTGGKPRCLISGGETTVTVKGSGKGGRNTELALAFAREIVGLDGCVLLSAGTDGNDGPTDAAGAIVDGGTIERANAKGLNPTAALENNDSYSFFRDTGELFVTGPTGTNVMDLQIVVLR